MTFEQIKTAIEAQIVWPEVLVGIVVAGEQRAVTVHLETHIRGRQVRRRTYFPGCIEGGNDLTEFYRWASTRIRSAK